MTKTIYLKDFAHKQRIQTKLIELGYFASSNNFGFYSGSEYIKNGKVIVFGSIGSRYTMSYSIQVKE
jgi:hypothetical protein